MSTRFANLFNWKRVLRLTSGVALAGGTVIGIGTVSLATASCLSINRIRPRTFTDDYHLNPEILRMPYQSVDFATEDGVSLRGWWIPATVHGALSNRIVILMHPYNNHKSNLLGVASALWYQGYSVFMFDFRSFAVSPKTRQTIGYLETFDAIAAINYVKNNHYINQNISNEMDPYKQKQIVLMGASMGGACAICASQSFKEDNIISAIVTDCTFSSLREICKYRIGIASSPWFPMGLLDSVVSIMDKFNLFFYNYSIDDVAPLDIVSSDDFDIPLLLLHSECDVAVPFSHSQRLYTNCKSSIKNLYCIKNGDHCAGYFINPNLFSKYLCHWVDDVLDHEMSQRKQRQIDMERNGKGEENDAQNVVINNEFIMFDTQSNEIGKEDEEGYDESVETKQAMNESEEVIIDGIDDSDRTLKVTDVSDETATEESNGRTLKYITSFFTRK